MKCAHTVSVKICMAPSASALRTKLADVEFLELELGVGLTSVAVVGGLFRSVVVVLGGDSTGFKICPITRSKKWLKNQN